jgi:SAM-dependent methyltransferase
MAEFIDILRCPQTQRPLRRISDSELSAGDGGPTYVVHEGIARLMPPAPAAPGTAQEQIRATQDFYESGGWDKDADGLFVETKAFADTRAVSFDFSGRCITRLQKKYLAAGGEYLLDAGSGPIPRDELLTYGDRFRRRICLDLSATALRFARQRIGDSGEFIQGDMTNLPLKDGTIDAVTCNHVIYQIPTELQVAAFHEIWRVLKPGGVAVVVYLWSETPLTARLRRLARRVRGQRDPQPSPAPHGAAAATPSMVHEPHSLAWFEAQPWPFRYTIDTFRVVNNNFMKNHVSDDWRGRLFLNALYTLQEMAPTFCGKNGAMPAIILRKP